MLAVEELIREKLDVWTRMRPPRDPKNGEYWLDVKHGRLWVVIQWSRSKGFGVSPMTLYPDDTVYGEGPAYVFETPQAAATYAIALLEGPHE